MAIQHVHAYRFGYLKSEKWKTVRLEAISRDNGECQFCGKSVGSFGDAHHLFYPTSVWDTKKKHLVTLCRSCHEFVHSNMEKSPKTRQGGDSVFRKLKKRFELKLIADKRAAEKAESYKNPRCWLCRTERDGLARLVSDHPKLVTFNVSVCRKCQEIISDGVRGSQFPFRVIRFLRAKKSVDTNSVP